MPLTNMAHINSPSVTLNVRGYNMFRQNINLVVKEEEYCFTLKNTLIVARLSGQVKLNWNVLV